MADQLKDLGDQELVHRVLQRERELVGARFKHSRGQLENTAELRVIRRDIARLRTEARRREQSEGLTKDALLHTHRSSYEGSPASAGEEAAEKGGFLSGIVDRLTGNE